MRIIWGAVCSRPQTYVNFSTKKGATAGAIDYMSESYKNMHYNKPYATTLVPCAPMSEYIRGINHINFFSLDVEGAELTVLQTIDFTKVTIDAFVIEMDAHDERRNTQIRILLKRKGYIECVSVDTKVNYIFVNKYLLELNCVSCGKAGRVE